MFWKIIYDKYVKLSLLDIALGGIFIALYIVSYKFIKINLIFMRIGISHTWIILIGLIFKPFNAILIAIIADTLAIFSSSRPFWMFEYAIIAPGIVIFVSLLKFIVYCKKDWFWIIFTTFTMFISIIVVVVFCLIYHNFTSKSQIDEAHFLFNHFVIYTTVGIAIFLITVFYCYLITKYYVTWNHKYKVQASILTIISLVIILFIWIWGPIAQMRYLSAKNWPIKSYNLYLVPRVLKTAIILPIYFIIINGVYSSYQFFKFNQQHKW